jgi:hypothetical protein
MISPAWFWTVSTFESVGGRKTIVLFILEGPPPMHPRFNGIE